MISDDFQAACGLILERGVEGFGAEVNLAVMALAEAIVEGQVVLRDEEAEARASMTTTGRRVDLDRLGVYIRPAIA